MKEKKQSRRNFLQKTAMTGLGASLLLNSTSSTYVQNVTAENFEQMFPLGNKNDGFAQYFTGQSYLAVLTTSGIFSANITFEPRCRNHWHTHHKGGQILYCTAGTGWYQEEGKPAQLLNPGDVVNIAPEVKHWHGATKDSWFSHIALSVPAENASNEWFGPVTDEEYSKLD